MNTPALVNLSPVLQMMLMGCMLALGPLAWVWLRRNKAARKNRLQALTLLTLFLTFDLVLFGAFTRLTDSGLGCPDWPGCYGHASPVGAQLQIAGLAIEVTRSQIGQSALRVDEFAKAAQALRAHHIEGEVGGDHRRGAHQHDEQHFPASAAGALCLLLHELIGRGHGMHREANGLGYGRALRRSAV